MRTVTYSREALKALDKMPANTARLLRSKAEQYATNPASLANNLKALHGVPGYCRLRVGDWRLIFREDGQVVNVTRIAVRGSVYD